MQTDEPNPTICPFCGEPVPAAADQATAICPRCHPPVHGSRTPRPAGEIVREVWRDLSATETWAQVAGWAILLGTTLVPVVVLWGANRLDPDDPLLPLCIAVSVVGGAIGMPLLYPKKGSWLPGIIAGPLFGPGMFLAFWLLAGNVLNRLVLLGLTIAGGGPSFALYVWLLYRRARQSELETDGARPKRTE